MPWPPGERITAEAREIGEGGASNELRTVMEGVEVVGEEMDKGEESVVNKDGTEA